MHSILRCIAIMLLFAMCMPAQQQTIPDVAFDRSQIPSDFWRPLDSLGKRAQSSGYERATITGQFTDAEGSRTVVFIQQLPGLGRLEGFSKTGQPLLFDGERPNAGLSPAQEDIIESMVLDTPEGFLSAIQQGAAARLIGQNFGPDPKREPHYDGIRYDIYALAAPARTRKDEPLRFKRYYFDHTTGLLLSTRYYERRAGHSVRIETRFSSWGDVSGSFYPGQIERYENGKLGFRFTATGVLSGPQQDINAFRIP